MFEAYFAFDPSCDSKQHNKQTLFVNVSENEIYMRKDQYKIRKKRYIFKY